MKPLAATLLFLSWSLQAQSVVVAAHDILKEEGALTDELRKTVSQQIRDVIARSSGPSVEAALREKIKGIQVATLDTWGGPDVTNTPFAVKFQLYASSWYCVSYSYLTGGAAIPDSHAVLQFYSGKNKMTEADTSALRGRTLFVHQVPRQVSGEERFLVWGNRIGDTGVRLSARLYSFDGNTVKAIWERDDLTAGALDVGAGYIDLSYDPTYHAKEYERIRSRLYFTPNGLE